MRLERGTLAESGIAYQRQVGDAARPGLVFLCGFGTDMNGSKAAFLAEHCAAQGLSFVRFDYRGCGASTGGAAGAFSDGTIGRWLDDALAVLDRLTQGPQIIVGSSMGGWIGLLLARQRAARIAAFVGIAAAPDFTEALIWPQLSAAQKTRLFDTGILMNDHAAADQQRPVTLRLIEEARAHLMLDTPLAMDYPVRLIQGLRDTEVPWQHALRLCEHIIGGDIQLILSKNGDHRLSSPRDLELLRATIAALIDGPLKV